MTPTKIQWTKTSIGHIAHVGNVLYKDRASVLELPEMQEGDRLGKRGELAYLWFEERESVKDFPKDYTSIWCARGVSRLSGLDFDSRFGADGRCIDSWLNRARGVFVVRPYPSTSRKGDEVFVARPDKVRT